MQNRGLIGIAALALAALLPPAHAQAQTLYQESFETDLGGWGPSGFSARPITINRSNLAASDGQWSMAVTQTGGGFSWNTKREGNASNVTDPFYQAWNVASTLPESQVFVEFDVIYRTADIPDTGNFMNVLVYMNNDNGFRQIPADVALLDQPHIANNIDQTFHVTIPISQFGGLGDRIPTNGNFYQLGWSMNGDWGDGDATVYFDNVKISVVPEPASVGALGLAGLTALARRRRSARV